MDTDEADLIGEPLEDVPKQPPDYDCNARRHDDGRFQGYCGARAGKGTDHVGEGRCSNHGGNAGSGGARDDAGAPADNTNAVSHGAYADQSQLYSEEFSDQERGLADSIFQDYLELYQTKHGVEPPAGHKLRLFKMAVNAVTEMRVENWYTQKPERLDTDVPYINRETHYSESGQQYYRYKKAPSVAAIKHLEGYNRKWLAKLGLLPDDGADVEVNVVAKMWDDLTGYYED